MNRLSQQTSPYLLQHAHNPVDWFPWGEEALSKAKTENKPILVSIGYSACHWCHVMERECFEKESIAEVMNAHFVCIKVDREERPDVDAVYMDAVQAMGVRGGWPLNVFLLPDSRPFYGVTYLPPQNWVQLMKSIDNAFQKHYDELAGSAEGFVQNMLVSDTEKYGLVTGNGDYVISELDIMFEKLQLNFDTEKGGMDRAPKFPMPSIYKFLLRYFDISQNPQALAQLELSLDRIALGGIYDHVGGGWARYSVDDEWFIPHFEKMLYDNAQLLSIYAEAYSLTRNPLYEDRLLNTIQWLQNEMRNEQGGFYSALDADSEGVEGKFYIWTKAELQQILGEDFEWFAKLYNVSEHGNWEDGHNHLHLTNTVLQTASALKLNVADLEAKYRAALKKLGEKRAGRIRPGLDDKTLTSWNGLLIKGLADSYRALGHEYIREMAVSAGAFIRDNMIVGNKLMHSYKNGRATVTGFLEDYAAVTEAYLALYQITFDEQWITLARKLADYTIDNFYDQKEGFFYFTDIYGETLITRKKELFDNVIPSSNSIMAHNLYLLGMMLDEDEYARISDTMLSKMSKVLLADVQWVTNWAALYCMRASPTAEIIIVGADADDMRKDFDRFFVPNKLVMGTITRSDLPLLKSRTDINGKTAIYVCYDKTCQLPVTQVEYALDQLAGA
ncbi:thioredoxin domain-containing protein [Dyadobacter fanqingshengii]|uniref:Thioredoxin domain-containing protein n=1 Tax=Dyadobacter fanqingshengii TaxID=2906443 RepID=A0A9X1PF09_9BACT|nr:thioredoxin domain-containing protein [Dyadobacter fanqingshengii]MCF0042585.1 thioredoxin domain-containing protein [Dyadobacter fanqingshengii]USJ36188.1 thioredoxin domain-containing protein [Dyadobacter fanqingshengii]